MTARSLRQPGVPADIRGPDGDPARAIRRLRWAILLNSLFVALELAAGSMVNSLALISLEDQSVSSGGLLAERIRKALHDRFRISHATIQLEVALPAPVEPLPILHTSGAIRQ